MAHELHQAGAAISLHVSDDLVDQLVQETERIAQNPELYRMIAIRAADVCDGGGADRVVEKMLQHRW